MLVGRAQNYTSDDPTLNPPLVEGQANPMRRDTVQIPSMNSVTLRLTADNPGVWMLHCNFTPLLTSCSHSNHSRQVTSNGISKPVWPSSWSKHRSLCNNATPCLNTSMINAKILTSLSRVMRLGMHQLLIFLDSLSGRTLKFWAGIQRELEQWLGTLSRHADLFICL
jgi:Multicopper oxidase